MFISTALAVLATAVTPSVSDAAETELKNVALETLEEDAEAGDLALDDLFILDSEEDLESEE
jgi:hypothetical protein